MARMDTMAVLDSELVKQARIELAAICRWAARLGMQSGIDNHFSLAVPGRPDLMLINPEGWFWSEVTASSLVMATHDGGIVSNNGNRVEVTAFCIHAPIHRLRPQATAVLHTHMPHATAICSRVGGTVSPSYLSAMSIYGRIAYDRDFSGLALTPAEGERLAALLGDNAVLMMDNHGPLVVGTSCGEALLRLMYLEESCRIQLLAEAGGAKQQQIPGHILDGDPDDVERYRGYSNIFIDAVIRRLTREEPDFLS
jgi:ribulose-5-phosphate 4-epimerase/fuculose-1-phosphate aldolase